MASDAVFGGRGSLSSHYNEDDLNGHSLEEELKNERTSPQKAFTSAASARECGPKDANTQPSMIVSD